MISIILCTVFGIPIMTVIVLVVYWATGLNPNAQYMKFDNFKDLYVINPDRWELYSGQVVFVKPKGTCSWPGNYPRIHFKFNLTDFYRYRFWKRDLEKQKRIEKDCKQLQEVIFILKSDLEKFEKKNAKNMDAAAKHTIELCGKIKGKNLTAQDIQEYLKQAGYNVVINPSETSPGPKTRREMEIKEMVDKLRDI